MAGDQGMGVIVFPMEKQTEKMPKNVSEIDVAMRSLIGAVPDIEQS